jgi:beta-N-acetylhexosaminidase
MLRALASRRSCVPDLARLAGLVLCTGFPGDEPSDAVLTRLRELQPGAFVLFGRNVSDVERTRNLVAAVRDAAAGDAPALACVDQEGGRVLRLRFGGEVPSMLALGATNDVVLAERAGARLASELRAIGANVDFAPVLDLALEPRGTAIGTRSLGDDPERVARLGAALVRGLQSGGVAAVAKHFPGHGATEADSHVALPIVAQDAATLRARDLAPFRAAFAAGVRAVMTAHVVVASIDPDRPATLSSAILTDLLRRELAFPGVCFTDCLQMDAIARGVGTIRGAVEALAAGADSLVISNDLTLATGVRDAIVAAVGSGALSRARLEEAAGRVARLRSALALENAAATRAYPLGDELAHEIARRAVVVVRGEPELDVTRPVTVVSFEGAESDGIAATSGERPSLSLALRRRRLRSELLRVVPSPDDAMRDMLVDVLRTQGERNVVVVARRAHLRPAQRRAIDAILAVAPAAIVISALEPFDVPSFARARAVVCSFGDDESNIEALADVLTGRSALRGSLPVAPSAVHA